MEGGADASQSRGRHTSASGEGAVPQVIAIDIGGTKVRSALVETGSGVISHVSERVTGDGAAAIVASVIDAATALQQQGRPKAIGIASAGVIDPVTGAVTSAGPTIPGWAGTELGARVATACNLPTSVANDVHAAGWGELGYGGLRGSRTGLLVAVGTGVGVAACVEGSVVLGGHGLGGTGARVEWLASGPGIVRLHNGATARRAHDLREVARRLADGDAVARSSVVAGAEALGRWLAPQVELLDPEKVIICGGVTHLGAVWHETLAATVREAVDSRLADVAIELSGLDDHAQLLGAAWQAVTRPVKTTALAASKETQR